MVVEQRRREREAAAHLLERVVANDPELLYREAGYGGLMILSLHDPVDPPIDRLDLAHGSTRRRDDVLFGPLSAQDRVLPSQLSHAQREDHYEQKGDQRQDRNDHERQGQLIVRQVRHGARFYTGAMRSDQAKDLLNGVRDGSVTVEEAVRILRRLPFDDIDFAHPDTHRELRQGFPEAIYAEHKTAEQVVAIARRLLESTSGPVLVTRVPTATAETLAQEFPDAVHHESARLVVLRASERPPQDLGLVAVVTAGTSDLPVADEAAVVAETLGARVERLTDVGVAGLHRLLAYQDLLHTADVIIVVAGMEGALASLVGGISSAPVVAVPTSVGYGASFEGLAALLAMLNSCAAGLVVTNIDNGFGAAVFAARVLQGRRP